MPLHNMASKRRQMPKRAPVKRRVVYDHQFSIARHVSIEFDAIDAELDRSAKTHLAILRPQVARAAMPNDQNI